MSKEVMTSDALDRIRGIHKQSLEFNDMVGMPHQRRLLDLMRKHIDEIEELADKQDPHYLVETGDLLILCYELILDGGASIDEITLKCFERYEKKLNALIHTVKCEEGRAESKK